MKVKPQRLHNGAYYPCHPNEATHLELNMPGPFPFRMIPIGPNGWTWTGGVDSPTLNPSIRTSNGRMICHSWVKEGRVCFCTDSTHELAGKSMDLFDVESDDEL